MRRFGTNAGERRDGRSGRFDWGPSWRLGPCFPRSTNYQRVTANHTTRGPSLNLAATITQACCVKDLDPNGEFSLDDSFWNILLLPFPLQCADTRWMFQNGKSPRVVP
jgi:hypothetical protein